MDYVPLSRQLAKDEDFARYVDQELQQISKSFIDGRDFLIINRLAAVPAKYEAGMFVRGAAGVFGVLAGTYVRNDANTAWVFIG